MHQHNIQCVLQDAEIAHRIAGDISPDWLNKFEEIDIADDDVEYLAELASTSPTAWHSGYLCMLISIKSQCAHGLGALVVAPSVSRHLTAQCAQSLTCQ